MTTPINKPKFRMGLSRQSGSKKFTPPSFTDSTSTPACSSKAASSSTVSSAIPSHSRAISSSTTASTTTPNVSAKKGARALAIQKRKLEFAAVSHIKQEKEEVNYETMNLIDLRKLVEEKRKIVDKQARHDKEQEELKALIEKWKQAGQDGLEMLRKIILPTPTIEALLDSFKMPHDEFE